MEATRDLITNHLQIPADAIPHGDIQTAAEIPFTVLEELAEELGARREGPCRLQLGSAESRRGKHVQAVTSESVG